MGKIDEIIREKALKPKDCTYHTNRLALNKKKQSAGKIRVLALEETAHVEYTCPECENESYKEQPWKRPFSVKCEKCGFRITVPKMKDQAKREMKGDNQAEQE